jgi:hypothetical protein
LKVGFEEVGSEIAEGRISPLSVLISEIMADFQPGLEEMGKAAAVKQFRFQLTPTGFSVGVIGTVTVPPHTLHRLVARH